MPFPEHVSTARLRLHRWSAPAHTPALAVVNAFPEAVRFLNESVPYTAEETARQSERFDAHWSRHGFGLWAVEAAGTIVGFAGVCHPAWFPEYEREVEAGWRLHPDAWGNGYATEAGAAALEAAFAHLELERVVAFIDPVNTASCRVAARLGMTLDRDVPHPQRPGAVSIWQSPVQNDRGGGR